MKPTQEHLTGFFMGMQHALKIAEQAKRDKALAIKQEIITLKLCGHRCENRNTVQY